MVILLCVMSRRVWRGLLDIADRYQCGTSGFGLQRLHGSRTLSWVGLTRLRMSAAVRVFSRGSLSLTVVFAPGAEGSYIVAAVCEPEWSVFSAGG